VQLFEGLIRITRYRRLANLVCSPEFYLTQRTRMDRDAGEILGARKSGAHGRRGIQGQENVINEEETDEDPILFYCCH
jgi:hypothetical protein